MDDIVAAVLRAACGALSALLSLLAPRQAERAPTSPLHAALLNVTSDATRAADLMHEFISMEADPALQQRFMAFLSLKAATNYARVDQQLSWVLWVYSTLWMPLLIVLCLSRGAAGGGSRRREDRGRAQLIAGAAPADKLRGLDRSATGLGGGGGGGAGGGAGPVESWVPLQHSASAPARRGHAAAADEFGADAGRGGALLRRSATTGAPVGARRSLGGKGGGGYDAGAPSRDAGMWDVPGGADTCASDQVQRPLSGVWGPVGNGSGLKAAAVRSAGLHSVPELG